MIKSEAYRGKIFAGETPLACTIVVEQTDALQLTVRAGEFRTTGQARVVDVAAEQVDQAGQLIAQDKAAWVEEGKRLRVWLTDEQGNFIDKARILTLEANQVIDIMPDADFDTAWVVDLGVLDGAVEVLVRARLDDPLSSFADPPAGWQQIQTLAFEFAVPAGATELPDVYVLTVEPGFPEGTGAKDWLTQTGSV